LSAQQSKRRYRNALPNVEQGFRACWQNAQDLVKASDQLLAAELYGPALSLAVLALEELGKLVAIDGLLFARPDDGKAGAYKQAIKSHSLKLSIFEMLPLLLGNLARSDSRCGVDRRFNLALAMSIKHLQNDGNDVMTELNADTFEKLDECKQRGFYTTCTDSGFISPRSSVSPALAGKVRQLAWRATTTLDFVLKEGNLERYIDQARSIRSKLSEGQHQEMEKSAQELANQLFPDLTGGESSRKTGA
jgi:AbiV family abortive infection protein